MRPRQLPIKTTEIHVCAFAPDGARALIGSQGNPVGLWELATGRLLREYEHADPVRALAWSRDQRFFLSLDGTMRLCEVETGECLREFDGRHARCVAWSADMEQVLSASNGARSRATGMVGSAYGTWRRRDRDAYFGEVDHSFRPKATGNHDLTSACT